MTNNDDEHAPTPSEPDTKVTPADEVGPSDGTDEDGKPVYKLAG